MPKVHILSGVLEGKVIDLIEERTTVGRALDNMVRLEDGTVSHHHALLVQDGTDYKLRDLNSTNGTRVNGMRIVETKLHNGDQVRIGSVELRYESDLKKASQPLPPMVQVRALIDTGASHTCVDPTILHPLNLTPTGSTPVHTPREGRQRPAICTIFAFSSRTTNCLRSCAARWR